MRPVGVYGSGFLGTVISACLADFGMPVFCCDRDAAKLEIIAHGTIPFHEKNLEEVIRRGLRTGRLVYSSELEQLVPRAQVMFFADDSVQHIEEVSLALARLMAKDGILVLATPVAVGTATKIEKVIKDNKLSITVVSHPMFLTDGCAVEDFNWPDRLIFGTSSQAAIKILKQIYNPVIMRAVPVVNTNHETAELVRQASTAFLATKISFVNELAAICDHVKADSVSLALALGLDKKIAPRCLQPGSGFGGPFTAPDMDSLEQLAQQHGVALTVVRAAREVNVALSQRLVEKITGAVHSIEGKQLGLLGLAFKPNTNSVAGSSSMELARNLISKGANVRAYDPVAISAAKVELTEHVRYCDSAYAAAEGTEALVVGTAWPEFRALDFAKIKKMVKKPVIVDTKNLLDPAALRQMGFQYIGIGRA